MGKRIYRHLSRVKMNVQSHGLLTCKERNEKRRKSTGRIVSDSSYSSIKNFINKISRTRDRYI